jgi:hypothetical protein
MHVLGTWLIVVVPVHVLRHRPLRFLQRIAVEEGARKTLHSAIKLFFLQEQAISNLFREVSQQMMQRQRM